MELLPFFEPIVVDNYFPQGKSINPELLVSRVWFVSKEQEPDLSNIDIAILGVSEARYSANNEGCSAAPDEIRKEFYKLFHWKNEVSILDLGNLILGKTVEDTYAILSDILAYLFEQKVIPVILGGSNDIAFANYQAYAKLEKVVNIVSVDSKFDLGDEKDPISSEGYLSKIVLQQPNYLLNYSNVGFQTYLNSQAEIELMKQLFFETYRVGGLRQDMDEIEPIVRNAEMLMLDISAARQSDAPGNANASANGFYGEEICQIALFAGLSDKLSSFGIYEYNPLLDYNTQTSQLIAHTLWYFIEGFVHRQNDMLFKEQDQYLRHVVTVTNALSELVFYQSKKTGRWWIEIPFFHIKTQQDKKYFLPCSKNDFETARKDVVPERWWRTYHKLNR
ncbi:MAG: formimidoylglutamase [Bacteroidetes bacterium]|nr:formimidoylglutamase [Bacteroidota bacterium]MCL2302347.1 formimidoylglutamase [Lentimicrobiaceae bacterium]